MINENHIKNAKKIRRIVEKKLRRRIDNQIWEKSHNVAQEIIRLRKVAGQIITTPSVLRLHECAVRFYECKIKEQE